MSSSPKIIYILGSARCGSTVLDTLLGSVKDTVSVGELVNLVSAGWRDHDLCSCGKKGDECPFWAEVRKRWHEITPDLKEKKYIRLARSWERLLGWLSLVNYCRPGLPLYQRQTLNLYQAISDITKKSSIIDSSKIPGRGLALLKNSENIDFRFIHLVRDGRGVAWSLSKQYKKDTERGIQHDIQPLGIKSVARRWVLANRMSEHVRSAVGPEKSLCVRYEDMVDDPKKFFEKISLITLSDYSDLSDKIERGEGFQARHTIAGNRVRMKETIHLQNDQSWKENLDSHDIKQFEKIAGKTLAKYGYLS